MEYPGYVRKSGRTVTPKQSTEGNPRFLVEFADGTAYLTARNAGVAYQIENSEYDGDVWVKLRGGEIIDIQPVEAQP